MSERNVIHLPTRPRAEVFLPPEKASVVNEMLDYYSTLRVDAHGLGEDGTARAVSVILDFIRFSRQAPWEWGEEVYIEWCRELGKTRGIVRNTQKGYQTAIRVFVGWLEHNQKFQVVVFEKFRTHIKQFINRWNSIPHLTDRQDVKKRRGLNRAEIQQFFDGLLTAIEWAEVYRQKDAFPLKRDYAMFYTIYVLALRAGEAGGMDFDSFQPNDDVPALGDFGIAAVVGKGSRGSGPIGRDVPVTHIPYVEIMEWYIRDVRSRFLLRASPGEKALFLTERGTRISYSAMAARFQKGLVLANLQDKEFVLHCLRHSGLSHECQRFSAQFVQHKAGHVRLVTTQGYITLEDAGLADELSDKLNKPIDGRD